MKEIVTEIKKIFTKNCNQFIMKEIISNMKEIITEIKKSKLL